MCFYILHTTCIHFICELHVYPTSLKCLRSYVATQALLAPVAELDALALLPQNHDSTMSSLKDRLETHLEPLVAPFDTLKTTSKSRGNMENPCLLHVAALRALPRALGHRLVQVEEALLLGP